MRKRVFVLGIDGVPFTFLEQQFNKKRMKSLYSICGHGSYKKMNSVYPTISSVAWTSFSTGTNPAEHSIFGFVDRNPNPFQIFIPVSSHRKADSLWKSLSQKGIRVIVINIPLTFPAEQVNGILASGFLCTSMDKLCYPESYNSFFKSKGYIIDVDAWLARKNKQEFMNELFKALKARFEIAFELLEIEDWAFFQLHIMETDRLLHFFWDDIENGGKYHGQAMELFELLDNYIYKLSDRLTENDDLIILSDHGFCSIKNEVQLNKWLEEENLLKFPDIAEKKLPLYHHETICYSILPGRIFINLEGREEKGTVKKADYNQVREMIKEKLLAFKHRDTGEKIIDKVFFREEIYSGPYMEKACDIIAHPVNGFDLKGNLDRKDIFEKTALDGMHTYDDAFICSNHIDVSNISSIEEVKVQIEDILLK